MSEPITEYIHSEFIGQEDIQRQWRWLLGLGIVWIILAGWSSSARWAIGVLAGIELIFGGVSLSVLGLALRKV